MDKGGSGAGAALGVLLLLGLIIEFFWVIVAVVAVVAVVLGLLALAGWAHEQAEARRRCPVCSGWSGSVMLTELDERNVRDLCPPHAARHRRLWQLEQEVRPWEA